MKHTKPKPADKFTFGLWTVGNPGRDPFGDPCARRSIPCGRSLPRRDRRLGRELPRQRPGAVRRHRGRARPHRARRSAPRSTPRHGRADGDHQPVQPSGLQGRRVHAHDAEVRALRAAEDDARDGPGRRAGRETYVFWGGREGAEVDAGKDPVEAIKRFREALDFLCDYARDQGYDLRFALEAKPNEPRGDIYFPTTAPSGLHPDARAPGDGGRQPRVRARDDGRAQLRPRRRAGDRGRQAVPHRPQRPEAGRFDQDLRFGSETIKPRSSWCKLLEEQGYDGPRHFDAHAYRTEDDEGVWDFARGCMRTYLILKEKARAFAAHAGIQAVLAEIRGDGGELGRLLARRPPRRSRPKRSIARRSRRAASPTSGSTSS